MMSRLKKPHVSWLSGLVLGVILFVAQCADVRAQSIVVMVNGDPVTSYELAQRQRFLAMHGVGDKLRDRLKSESTQQAYRALMTKERPSSQAEAQEIQKKFVAQLQQNVLAEVSGSLRKQALDELIDEKLMMQAARDLKLIVTDQEVDQFLTERAQAGERKMTLPEFLAQLSNQGINPSTLKAKIKAAQSWRQVIRQTYMSRIQADVSITTTTVEDDSGTVDVLVIRLAIPAPAAQGQRYQDAEKLAKRIKNCASANEAIKGVEGASVTQKNKAKLTDFHSSVRPAIQKAQVGQTTPPVFSEDKSGVEIHAICSKAVAVASGQSKKGDPQEKLHEAFQLYSRRHLKDLKDHARLDYPKGNG